MQMPIYAGTEDSEAISGDVELRSMEEPDRTDTHEENHRKCHVGIAPGGKARPSTIDQEFPHVEIEPPMRRIPIGLREPQDQRDREASQHDPLFDPFDGQAMESRRIDSIEQGDPKADVSGDDGKENNCA